MSWDNTHIIDSVQLPGSDTKYFVADAEAREKIDALVSVTHFLGVTTTELTDGASTNPIKINGEDVTAVSGDIAIYKKNIGLQEPLSLEFIFDGTYWQLLGGQTIEGAGDLAYANTASTSYTPEGTVTTTVTASNNGNVVTDIIFGDVYWSLEGSNYNGRVLTDVTIGGSSSDEFVSEIDFQDIETGGQTAEGTLPDLTDVTTTGATASVSGTTLIFGGASVSYNFNRGAFPEYSFATISGISNVNKTTIYCTTTSTDLYLRSNSTGSAVYKGNVTTTFNGSSATITVSADSNS